MRLDKWLWAARFYKTRTLAVDEIGRGRVRIDGHVVKASKEVRIGDRISLAQGACRREVVVRGLSQTRGPAPAAQALYEETSESLAERERLAELRRFGVEPALDHADGRPTKRDRREWTEWQRWSASIDDA